MKRLGILTLAFFLVLALFCGGAAMVAAEEVTELPPVPQEPVQDVAIVEDRAPWQIFVEDKLLPTLGAVASGACTLYILILPVLKKITAAALKAKAAADGFDSAAGGIRETASDNKALAAAVEALRAELKSDSAKVVDAEERNRELVGVLLRVVALAFSHESELVRNGTAREIMKEVEAYVAADDPEEAQ
jgi:hypothetical protein